MKIIVNKEELKEKLKLSIDLLCDTVKTTLGPKGSNVIIDHSSFSPFITNDGVTIAENIESEDPVINTILTLAKEASIKTNEVVGDGTTTTLVLLQSIFNLGLDYINDCVNPLIIKRELEDYLQVIVKVLKDKSRKPNKDEIRSLASIAANDDSIGDLLTNALFNVGDIRAIRISEGNSDITKVNYIKGYNFETSIASNHFFFNKKEIKLDNANVLIFNIVLESLEDISLYINEIIHKNENLVIIAKDYDELFIREVLSLNLDDNFQIYLLKNPEYGSRELIFLEDLKDITNSKIIDNLYDLNKEYMGYIKHVNINKDTTNFEFSMNDIIKNKIINLEKDLKNKNVEDEDYAINRLNMFKNGFVEILVGAPTVTERREMKMRFDDALCALNSLDNGVLPGSGIAFLEIALKLNPVTYGEKILKEALTKPFEQIMNNAALDYQVILNKIKENNYSIIYNINTECYENISDTSVIDVTNVLISSITNAISIASMLLTTTSLVINEYQNNSKINDFNEL